MPGIAAKPALDKDECGRNRTMDSKTMTKTGVNAGSLLQARDRVRRMGLGACLAVALAAGALPAQANPFSPVITVNDRVITQYELDQRVLFMQILRQPGDLAEMARTGLIEDRLRMVAAKEYGIKLTPDQIVGGMTEFAARANLSTEEFTKIVGQMGLQPESFRDFVEAGMAWREVVRARYAGKVSITEAEIDRAIANFQPTSAVTLSLSELVLPASGEDRSGALALARRLQSQIVTEADFAAAARANSSGPTAGSGGVLKSQTLADAPEEARAALLKLAPGAMSAPVMFDDKIVIYWMRDRVETPLGKAAGTVVDYAQFLVPDSATAGADLAAVRARVDTCNDLYAVAKGLPADRLLRETKPQSAVVGDIGAVLATLDAGESATQIRRGGYRVFLMLCSRGPAAELVPDRAMIQEQLLNQRLGSMADIYMEELRSEAIIVEK